MEAQELAARIVARAAARGVTIAVAESLTGGLVAETLVRTPGASLIAITAGQAVNATPLQAHACAAKAGI